MDLVEDYVRNWLKDERAYTLHKFGIEKDNLHIKVWNILETPNEYDESWWSTQLDNYYFRAGILGLDTVNGRQALAKFVATAIGMLEACVREFGYLPEPGVPSGENLDNLRTLDK